MTTKLTLTVEKSVIEKAKSYAKKTGRSLSEIIEKYLVSITNDETNEKTLSPKLKRSRLARSSRGNLKMPGWLGQVMDPLLISCQGKQIDSSRKRSRMEWVDSPGDPTQSNE